MADLYVNSVAGSNTAPYDTWAKGATTLATAASASAAGDDIWVASDHAETAASAKTITFPNTGATPNRCISVNRAGSTPPVAADILAGGSVTTTGNSNITITGNVYIEGLTFNCGTGAVSPILTVASGANNNVKLNNCTFSAPATSSPQLRLGNATSAYILELDNCSVSFGSTSAGIYVMGARVGWKNRPGSAAVTGTLPTTLFNNNGANGGVDLVGLDLSAFGSGTTLIGSIAAQSKVRLINCKLGASVTIATTPTGRGRGGVDVIGCSTTTNVSRNERYLYEGTLTTETTIIRTAGASDGTTAYSWKIVTTADSKRTFPFETFEGALWNATTGSSKTLTVHTVTDNVTLTDAEIWLEVEYLGSSATPVATLITDANATVLTTAANQTSDSGEAWTTTGLGTPVKQALAVTFTPQMAGPIRWKVKVAKASTTVYVCPNADLS